ncbi:MAG: hypothetical protein VB980_06540 [Opitutales bacterium]
MKDNTSESKEVAAKQQCILDCCKYPQTCGWNLRCMEVGMRASKEAKVAREATMLREMDDAAEK